MINGIENASRNVSLDNLDQLAEALGTETYVLLLPTLRPDYMRRSNDSIKVAE
jgi:transcriptional regulator with XRE-family HTH domain